MKLYNSYCIVHWHSKTKEKHININNFGGLSTDWVGGKHVFTCSWGSFILGVKEHINKISRETWDNLLKILFTFFFSGKLRCFWVKWGEKLENRAKRGGAFQKFS